MRTNGHINRSTWNLPLSAPDAHPSDAIRAGLRRQNAGRYLLSATTPMDPATQRRLLQARDEVVRYSEDDIDQTLVCPAPAHAFQATELEDAYLDGKRRLPAPSPLPRESLTAERSSVDVALFWVLVASLGTLAGMALEMLTG